MYKVFEKEYKNGIAYGIGEEDKTFVVCGSKQMAKELCSYINKNSVKIKAREHIEQVDHEHPFMTAFFAFLVLALGGLILFLTVNGWLLVLERLVH